MSVFFSPKNNPRVIIIQKLYGNFFNGEVKLSFPKHRFKKFIKDIVTGTIERDEILIEEIKKTFGDEFSIQKTDKVFQVILKSSTYEILYKPKLSLNIIIKEYLDASNFFLEFSQTKYLNALIDKLGKNLRSKNEWI